MEDKRGENDMNEHSNICYILERNAETKQLEFIEVDGISVKNSYGLDLFRYKRNGQKNFTVTEGQTGLKICEIGTDNTYSEKIASPKDIDSYLETYHQIDKTTKHEKIKKLLPEFIEKNGLSPRYTEPNKKREPRPKKKTNSDLVFSKCLYEKGKKYFVRIFNLNGIQLFKRKDSGDDSYFTVYAPCNDWMISLGSNGQMNMFIEKLTDGFDLHKWLLDSFETQMTDDNKWADLGIADYLGRREEAEAHNEPIRAARDEQKRIDDEERQRKIQEREKAKIDVYNKLLADAEASIRNCSEVSNSNIETPTGNESSVILELMKKYNIDIPIKTKGWVNNALVRITFKDSDYTYSYFKSSTNSTVFRKYLCELISKIKGECAA